MGRWRRYRRHPKEAATRAHIWADKPDGGVEDVFDLPDKVTASVVAAIEPRLRSREMERARQKPTENLQAYDFFLRALANLHRATREPVRRLCGWWSGRSRSIPTTRWRSR